MSSLNKLQVVKQTRKITADSFYISLKKLLNSSKLFSEVDLRDAWLFEFRKHKDVFPEGWYIPPPHGFEVLFATDKNVERFNYASIRPKKHWSRKNIFFDKDNGLIFVYASPVDKKSGIIGDFEMTLYIGKNNKIKKYLKTNLKLLYSIYKYAKVGMKFSEINTYANSLFVKEKLTNIADSITSPDSSNIIGHTIPFSYEDFSPEESKTFYSPKTSWKKTCLLISKKRVFVDSTKNTKVKPEMAITIEPRLKPIDDPSIPLIAYHGIILFKKNGEKELLTNFDEIFKLTGMNYMLNNL